MKIVDLSHPWNAHTPGWVGYAGSTISYTQTLQTNRITSQRIDTALHVGTHLDAPMHAADGIGDIASIPLTKLVHEGVIVDVSGDVGDWDIIKPEHITGKVRIKRNDILIIHTGFYRYYSGMPQQDLVRYFCMHPAGTKELAEWMLDVGISWWGVDTGSADHPMNTTIRYMRPDLCKQFEQKVGMPAEKYFGQYEYRHPRSGRMVKEELFPLHYLLFPSGCVHAENVGGDISKVLNQRCIIGAFPWKFEGGEACPCRILAIFDAGSMSVEEG